MNILTITHFKPKYKDRLNLRGIRINSCDGISVLIDGREHHITEKHLLLAQACVPLEAPAGRRVTFALPNGDGSDWAPSAFDHATDDPRIIAAAVLAQKSGVKPTNDGEWLPPLPFEQAVKVCEAFRARCIAGDHDSTIP